MLINNHLLDYILVKQYIIVYFLSRIHLFSPAFKIIIIILFCSVKILIIQKLVKSYFEQIMFLFYNIYIYI